MVNASLTLFSVRALSLIWAEQSGTEAAEQFSENSILFLSSFVRGFI